MLKEMLTTAAAVVIGVIVATIVLKKVLKTSSWESNMDDYETDGE